MLIFASGFLYWVLIATLEQEDEQFLNSRVHALDVILQTGNSEALEHEIAQENIGFQSSQYLTYSRILDESGHTLYEAPGMNREIPPAVFPDPDELTGKAKNWRSTTNRSYLLLAGQTGGGDTGRPKRQIQVALDETGEEMLISRYERYLIVRVINRHFGIRSHRDNYRAARHETAGGYHQGRRAHHCKPTARAHRCRHIGPRN